MEDCNEFNLFSDKFARIFFIFPSICPNFHGFPIFSIFFFGGGTVAPCPLSRTPMNIIILAKTPQGGGSLFVFKSMVIIVANTI